MAETLLALLTWFFLGVVIIVFGLFAVDYLEDFYTRWRDRD